MQACDNDPRTTVDSNYILPKPVNTTASHALFASTDSAYGIQEGEMFEDRR